MSNQSFLLHLTKSQSSTTCSTSNRLSRKQSNLTRSSRVHLVRNHIFQFQIKHIPNKNLNRHSLSSHSIIHNLFPIRPESKLLQTIFQAINSLTSKSRSIHNRTSQSRKLTSQNIHQISNSHTRRNTMRVKHNIRFYSTNTKRNILLFSNKTNNTFLPMRNRKLINNFRNSKLPHPNLHNSISFFIVCNKNSINSSTFFLMKSRTIFLLGLNRNLTSLTQKLRWRNLSNNNLALIHLSLRVNNTIILQKPITFLSSITRNIFIWNTNLILQSTCIIQLNRNIRSKPTTSSKATVNRTLIQNNSIVNVITLMRHNRQNNILPNRMNIQRIISKTS